MSIRITHEALEILKNSESWKSWPDGASNRITPEGAYGPEGAIKHIWGRDWDNAEDLEVALSQNMGGGVPYPVIRALVKICVALEE
jgi:hypothetical protein